MKVKRQLTLALVTIAAGIGASILVYSTKLRAQTPFQGYTAILNDYWNCDPAASAACASGVEYRVTVLPSGESSTLATVLGSGPNSGAPAKQLMILRRGAVTNYFPEVNRYYQWPSGAVSPPAQASSDCRPSASAVRSGEASILGYRALKYVSPSSGMDTVNYYLPAVGCLPARQEFTFRNGAVTQRTIKIASFIASGPVSAAAIELPQGAIEDSPLNVHHALFLARNNSLGPQSAEQRWQEELTTMPSGRQLAQLEERWEQWKNARGGVQ